LGVGVAAILGFGGTIVIMKVIDKVMGLRVKEAEEEVGLDITETGELAYGEEWGN
jgi:Amt family ammonium transporter